MSQKFVLILALFTLFLSGCSALWNLSGGHRQGASSSLVDYLYPDGQVPPAVSQTIPHLELPLRVGIAFVPGQSQHGTISEATRMQLLENVKGQFLDRAYIDHIEVIPDTYLRSSSGVTGMQQVARLYGVDVMALVSYDQVAVSEENPSGLLYWTIVGSYFIKATSNEVQTFVDTAVFDINTARLLFRAPGADTMSDRSTLVEAGETVRKARDASFGAAMQQMSGNLAAELDQFEERVKSDSTVASTSWREGHGGGGSFSVLALLGMLAARMAFAIAGRLVAWAKRASSRSAPSARRRPPRHALRSR
ncbi:MAG: rhombotarget lipoprotein [Woeseiaceae bacterium]|nr:rhombotarget lipoprotein [Woeseiaceae bacterium]